VKKAFYIGAIAGGILGLTVALSMDLMFGQSFGGGWSEAVANDMNKLFKTALPNNHIFVILGVIVVIGFIGAFGAFLGGLCTLIIAYFFNALTRENKP